MSPQVRRIFEIQKYGIFNALMSESGINRINIRVRSNMERVFEGDKSRNYWPILFNITCGL